MSIAPVDDHDSEAEIAETNGDDPAFDSLSPPDKLRRIYDVVLETAHKASRLEADNTKMRAEVRVGSYHAERAIEASNEARVASLDNQVAVKGLIAMFVPRLDAIDRKLEALIAAVSVQKERETP